MKTTNWQMIRFSSSIAAYCIIRLRIELLLLPWTQALGYSAGLAGNVFCFCLQDRKHLDWNILPVQTNNLLWHIQAHMDVLCLNGYPWLCGICVCSECHFFVGHLYVWFYNLVPVRQTGTWLFKLLRRCRLLKKNWGKSPSSAKFSRPSVSFFPLLLSRWLPMSTYPLTLSK